MSPALHRGILLLACLGMITPSLAQEGKLKKFLLLSGAEKRWVCGHLFVAGKGLRISERAQRIAKEQLSSPELDGYADGGQADAFRHTFWMASLAQQIPEKKAIKLGIAHEKGNRRDFKKRRTEDGAFPDAAGSAMDLWNNQVGVMIGKEHPDASEEALIVEAKAAVVSGRCRIVKRNANGDYLDANGKVVRAEEWQGKWVNARRLVSSDKRFSDGE